MRELNIGTNSLCYEMEKKHWEKLPLLILGR